MSTVASSGRVPGDSCDLTAWEIPEPLPAALYSSLQKHPRFAPAARALAGNMLALARTDQAVDGIFKDAGRYIAALCTASLHRDGITLPRLKALCAAFGMISAGRVRALLIYLRYLGYVSLWRERVGGGPALYIAAPGFLDSWRAHLKAALRAAAVIEPAVSRLISRLDEPTFFSTFCSLQAEGLAASTRQVDHQTPFVRIFLHRVAGSQIAWSLLLQGSDTEFPPTGPVRAPVAELARNFRVSIMHVKRLFADAAKQGMLTPRESGTVMFTNEGRAELAFHYSAQLVRLLVTAAQSLRVDPPRSICVNAPLGGRCSDSTPIRE